MVAQGSVGSYSNIDSNADAGQNVIVCAALATSLEAGDLVKIISDAVSCVECHTPFCFFMLEPFVHLAITPVQVVHHEVTRQRLAQR